MKSPGVQSPILIGHMGPTPYSFNSLYKIFFFLRIRVIFHTYLDFKIKYKLCLFLTILMKFPFLRGGCGHSCNFWWSSTVSSSSSCLYLFNGNWYVGNRASVCSQLLFLSLSFSSLSPLSKFSFALERKCAE
jgi:hypothetical protein